MAKSKSYDDMKCVFVESQGQEYIEKIKQFISKVKGTIANKELPRQVAEDAVHQAIAFFSQPLPEISEETKSTELDNSNPALTDELKNDIAELKSDVSNLTERLNEEKAKNLTHRKKLQTKVKRMETNHLLSVQTLEKSLSSVRKFIRRKPEVEHLLPFCFVLFLSCLFK
ncbi:hypothetical protein ElyMa_000656700 [Elysia marginata]|uniref:Uncharacterized protein n=1 Tax=Elysia marginata TaxID=1093978 RepID=A0AAV4GE68_9GAST|nr:hypothetical protein ElyMa_000656700 [Elysia marginata]